MICTVLSILTYISNDLFFIPKGVSDGISMGTSGMRYSLQSRDLVSGFLELYFSFSTPRAIDFACVFCCTLMHG